MSHLHPKLTAYMQAAKQNKASDIHIKVGSPTRLRVKGQLVPLPEPPLTPEEGENILKSTMPHTAWDEFIEHREKDYSIHDENIGRFRANAFYTRGEVSIILRQLSTSPPTIQELGVPPILNDIANEHNGLIIVAGATGSGKTTTLAAIIRHINETRRSHIVTIEDPIEIIHSDINSSISQREVGTDTESFNNALTSALRQDPDVILVGELRHKETAEIALQAAETGHLVLCTLHTNNAPETINRLLDLFPSNEHHHLRSLLSGALRAIICQRLLLNPSTNERFPLVEILRNEGRITDAIKKGDISSIEDILIEGGYGMQTFDWHLTNLLESGTIDYNFALENSFRRQDFKVKAQARGLAPSYQY